MCEFESYKAFYLLDTNRHRHTGVNIPLSTLVCVGRGEPRATVPASFVIIFFRMKYMLQIQNRTSCVRCVFNVFKTCTPNSNIYYFGYLLFIVPDKSAFKPCQFELIESPHINQAQYTAYALESATLPG